MSRGEKLIAFAKTFLGYKESPKNSNKTKFNVEYYGSNTAAQWCCIFVWYCLKLTGNEKYFKDGYKTASCTDLLKHDLAKGRGTTTPVAGDKVFFNFDNDPASEHIGFFIRWINKNTFETIEGNTAIGNDSNGGEVMIRTRNVKQVLAFTKTFYDEDEQTTPAKTLTVSALSGLWMRRAPYGDKILCLPNKARVKVLGETTNDGWVKVQYISTVGYCSAKYLK